MQALLALRWIAVLLLLSVAANLKSPFLLALRDYETPLILVLAAILGAISLTRLAQTAARGRKTERLFLVCLTLVVLLTAFGEARYHWDRHRVAGADPKLLRNLGQHFIVGYTRLEDVRPLVESGAVGGVYITARNVNGRSVADLRNQIQALRELRRQAGLPPLIVATDQEGGTVSRLSPPLTRLPPMAELVESQLPLPELEQRAQEYGAAHGRELAEVGVNVNFSPLVDLKYDLPRHPLDFYSRIAQRAIASDEMVVARMALAYTRGLAQHDVHATVKHFPGLGRLRTDTHLFAARLDVTKPELQVRDWVPFKFVLERSSALLMLGHVMLPDIDPEHPASYSHKLVQGVLRQEWNHDGLLITDDLSMGAIYRSDDGICRAAVKALRVGVDLVLIAYDGEKYYEAMSCVLRSYERQRMDLGMLERSAARIGRLLDELR